jgi:hypothetical protein
MAVMNPQHCGVRLARSRRGQAMIEYVVTAGLLIATISIFAVFLYAFKEYNGRVIDLVSSEYP